MGETLHCMCFYWEYMYFFSFPIHCPNVPPVVLCTWYSQMVSCCLVPCFEYVFLLRVHVFPLFSYPLPYCSTHRIMYIIFSGGELLSCHMFWVYISFESACISSLFLSIALMFHSSYYVHDILRRWVVVLSHVLSIYFFWECMYFFSFPIHCPNVPLVVLCTWYSQRVSCCLVPCFEYVFLLRVHVFLLFSYPLR